MWSQLRRRWPPPGERSLTGVLAAVWRGAGGEGRWEERGMWLVEE
jgi:hypothetical protein